MTTDNYDPTTALDAYYRSRSSREIARLWAGEKLLHDLQSIGRASFFEGPGTDPTVLPGYASDKIWLRTPTTGVTTTQATQLAWNGVSPQSNIANWLPLDWNRYKGLITGGSTAGKLDATADAVRNVLGYTPVPGLKRTIAFFGDSITAATTVLDTATLTANFNRGASFWVPFLTRQRVSSPKSLNFGVAGNTTADMLARVNSVIAAMPGICVVHGGTNDTGSAATTIANLNSIYDALVKAGIIVIAVCILPRLVTSGDLLQRITTVNNWIKGTAARAYYNFHVVDSNDLFGDRFAVNGQPPARYTYDNLHPTALGAYWMSVRIAGVVEKLVPEAPPDYTGLWDAYDGVNSPYGNRPFNSYLVGYGGGLTAGVTGQIADGWNATAAAGGGTLPTIVARKVVPAYGYEQQELQFSGSVAGGFGTLCGIFQSVYFLPGETVEASIEVEADNLAHVSGIDLSLASTGTSKEAIDGACSVADILPSDAFAGRLKTPPFVVPVGATFVYLTARVWFDNIAGTAAGRVRFSEAQMRKVYP